MKPIPSCLTGDGGRRTRRTSVQTDVSVQSDSDLTSSGSESDQLKTRSRSRSEDGQATKHLRRKLSKIVSVLIRVVDSPLYTFILQKKLHFVSNSLMKFLETR